MHNLLLMLHGTYSLTVHNLLLMLHGTYSLTVHNLLLMLHGTYSLTVHNLLLMLHGTYSLTVHNLLLMLQTPIAHVHSIFSGLTTSHKVVYILPAGRCWTRLGSSPTGGEFCGNSS